MLYGGLNLAESNRTCFIFVLFVFLADFKHLFYLSLEPLSVYV